MPRVSIGLPVYNGANYVEQAILSVLGQTYTNWELVISDNASSDGTQAICEGWAESDPRIRYVRAEENRGAAWNFNRAFELSTGEYFRWLSHDDCLAEASVASCVEVLDRSPEIVLCTTATAVIDSGGFQVVDAQNTASDFAFQGLSDSQEAQRRSMSASPSASRRFHAILMHSLRCYEIYGLVRRSVMASTQLHPAYCGGEKVLLAELALRGPFCELDEPLFFCRWHNERFTSNSSALEQAEHMAPGRTQGIALPHQYRTTLGYYQLLLSPGLGLVQRMQCLGVCLRFTLQVSKWLGIARNTVLGRATHATLAQETARGPQLVGGEDNEHRRNASHPSTLTQGLE